MIAALSVRHHRATALRGSSHGERGVHGEVAQYRNGQVIAIQM